MGDVVVLWSTGASQFACCDIYNVEFFILCCFTGVLAPDCFRELLRLVLLVVILFFIGFCLIGAGIYFA